MTRYFYLDAVPSGNDFMLRVDVDSFPFPNGISGSYNVLPARLMGLSWTDYLRFCRDILGAELRGKNTIYVVPYFKHTPEVRQFCKLLNKRMELIMYEREHPYTITITNDDFKKEYFNEQQG